MTTRSLSPEYALLGLLEQRPAHGYELHQRLSADLGHLWHISLSQAYNILKRLEAQGFIQGIAQPQENLPDRRLFHLTEAGRRRFEDWLNKPSGCSVRAIRLEFATRLYFAHSRDPLMADRLIAIQIEEVRDGLDRLERALGEVPEERLFNRLGLALRVRQLTSAIDWLYECRRVLESHGQVKEPLDG